MKKNYSNYFLIVIAWCLALSISSCKKENQPNQPAAITNYATIGLYERLYQIGNDNYRRVIMPVKIGTSNTLYGTVFDTGSTGLTIDANGILPAEMITSSGIVVPGDSILVNGIMVTSQQSTISFGGGTQGETRQYGNLAYTNVYMGDGNGNVTATRVPIFLYYKVVDINSGTTQAAHSSDVFGVGPGNSYANAAIGSPLSYFKLTTGVANGFKLALFSTAGFTTAGAYVPGLLTVGLTPTDLNSSGFIMHNLTYYSVGGYSPNISATINYNNKNVNALLLFDTGDPQITYLSDPTATANVTTLPANTPVKVTTTNGFSYQYNTGTTSNVTQVVKTSYSGDVRSIYSIDFFIQNQFLLDYQNHRIGLRNN